MGFGGSALAMIQSLRNNALPKRERLFNRKVYYSTIKLKPRKKVSKEKLEQARKKINAQNKKSTIKQIIAMLISILIVIALYYIIFELKSK